MSNRDYANNINNQHNYDLDRIMNQSKNNQGDSNNAASAVVGSVIVAVIAYIIIFLLWTYILQLAWNNFMPNVLGQKRITLTESFALLVGVYILFSTICVHFMVIPTK